MTITKTKVNEGREQNRPQRFILHWVDY